jgi:hypothetical protein
MVSIVVKVPESSYGKGRRCSILNIAENATFSSLSAKVSQRLRIGTEEFTLHLESPTEELGELCSPTDLLREKQLHRGSYIVLNFRGT